MAECENPVYPGTDRCGHCAACKAARGASLMPSTEDEAWDAWLLALIEGVRKKNWLNVLSLLNTITKQALIQLNDALKGRT